MRVTRSNRCLLNPKEEEILARMAKDGCAADDMEEGEISDTASIEEISEEDFNQDVKVSSKTKGDSRVWMDDLLKYPISSSYSSGLYNLAWAQAVQNKPLNEILVRDFGSNDKSMKSASNVSVNGRESNNRSLNSSKEVCKVIIDDSSEEIDSRMETVGGDEKEEGELEEGEIELDSETVDKRSDEGPYQEISSDRSETERDLKRSEFESRLCSIQKTLDSLTVEEAKKSFPGVCSELQTALESLQPMVLENRVPAMDATIRQSFSRLQAINSVFCSMNLKQQEQNKDIILRLLESINIHALFSLEQIKEVEAMLSSIKAMDKKKKIHITDIVDQNNAGIITEIPADDMNSSKELFLDPVSAKSGDQNNAKLASEALRLRISVGSKSRLGFGPLLDLHRDHDADSLPSPTRETLLPFPVAKAQAIMDGKVISDLATTKLKDKTEDATLHPYETDALKAVSTYQQKFGRSSFLLSNRLPSPTPSEEGNDGDVDTNEEVSSSSTADNVRTVIPFVPLQPIGPAISPVDNLNGQGIAPAKIVGQLGSMPNPILRTSAKSRDPRLRYANSEASALDLNQRPLSAESSAPKSEPLGGMMSSRKHKVEDNHLDGHSLKRHKKLLMNSGVSRDVEVASGIGGWIEDNSSFVPQFIDKSRLMENMGANSMKLENGEVGCGRGQDAGYGHSNVATVGKQQAPAMDANTAVSLPSLLKDIAVNPSMLMHLIQMEQQRLAAEAQQNSGDPAKNMMTPSSSNTLPGTVPMVNVAWRPLEPEQKLVGKPHIAPQTASMGELGKIRMKPRDPRRVLHSNTFQKSEGSGAEQLKTNPVPQVSKDNLIVCQQEDQAEANSLSSQSISLPDIAPQFTKELKNLADILTSSQPTNTLPVVSQTAVSEPLPVKSDKVDAKEVVTDTSDQKSGSGLTPKEGAAGPPQNSWGDVEHLFEGYDDQQKAAIQRERARRIEEQQKMFAARKLCLVLDLDHTLLNSAKFVEVDPVHEEILRKKEEQDREKPQRHLFRFSHMGMWTKLRPGIWNFLEKASKLYELHLYTMGNKLYATEMAKVLDPTGALFAGRVISKGDDGDPFDSDERQPKSKDLEGVLGMESGVVIVDDSVRVWPHNKLNLIVVERYTYFPCSRRQFGLLGPSLLEIDHDERPEDGTLASSLAVIERIHQDFFLHPSLNEADVRNILAAEQRKILTGCRIVFSRIFPVGEANPHLHPLWQTAEQFGAVCTNQIDEQVTHVVANSLGTDKVNWALSTGRFVVHPGWVEASALLYRRVNEHEFAVKI
ncbi:RNA polymerase II C-terminal domain phosphatase-like 3 isoform X2 [Macadamia integrifolia]|uniref:RNA polymerase II C-terminal domain phosphatase-like 3 isoform X2 n=1 Tax=Macadamia integrifolia TaxID=60698 RepID=UPI001C52B679|nr:RNA polymerase II C-terminal domain phosphatase-like 3 isoform X2 [Macadamia integrifolia]